MNGKHTMWRNAELTFNLMLNRFKRVLSHLKGKIYSIFHFCSWLQKWEEMHLKKKNPLSDDLLPQKYYGLVFYDTKMKKAFNFYDKNMELYEERGSD